MKEKEIIKNKRIASLSEGIHPGTILLFIFLLPYLISFFFGNIGNSNAMISRAEQSGKSRNEAAEHMDFVICSTGTAGKESMPLEVYLCNRLPSVIDMNYEMEALKAQAVALRTEMMRLYYESGKEKRIFVEDMLLPIDDAVYRKAKQAVSETEGMYITYEGIPIKASYFALSAGATRNGNEALKSEKYPYLRSVMCERDFTSEEYVESKRVKKHSFYERLEEIEPSGGGKEEGAEAAENMFLENDRGTESRVCIERDRAGYVTDISIGDKHLSGEAFREAFLLNSSCFELKEEGDEIRIQTKGVGHGLGFCQYAANEAAKKGSDFIDILNYFFSDIVIEKTE